jgi:serine/threonine protein kinase
VIVEPGPTLNNGRYNLVEKLGTGGMSVVWRAEDTIKRIEVAIKVLKVEYARDSTVKKRFEDEAVLMSRIDHPNIVRVFDVGQDGDHLYLVMEIVGFGSLSEFLKLEGPLPPRWASEVMQSVLQGLHVAHDAGITHRDIKPQNILLTAEGVPKLADFGIARLADTEATVTGQRLGTPAYMSPEQLRSAKSVDHRSDLYSCAATLYTLVTGREAFDLSSPIRDDVLAQLPPDLAKVVGRGSHHHPDARYASAEAMRAALAAVHATLAEEPLKLPAPPRAPRNEPTMPLDMLKLEVPTDPEQGLHDGDFDEDTDIDMAAPDPKPAPPPQNPLDQLRKLPVPLWFVGVVAGSLFLIFGTFGLYVAASAYSAAASLTNAKVEAPAAPPPVVAAVAPAPVQEIPQDILEAEAAKDETAKVAQKVAYGSLAVRSKPTSEVSIDGKSKGWMNWTGKVSAGTHRVKLRSGDGQTHSASVKVKSGGTTSYCWDFNTKSVCK